ncbi:uncharacterized protein LOC126974951 [Leptidea sinapis]|uniref:uncharacterized protein LOC126974951 n=1 Tax=Leptidea sinapis TaxID=189913 RepID=UPI00212BEC0B|nr:uncharacterized protein LOC126974951 [Leptidea sinapis]
MGSEKCVVEGCNLEYDVICSFSFYNVNTTSDSNDKRQEWIDGAMQEESECLWRHVSLQLCGYHFELDNQGLWIDSPMLPELLTPHEPPPLMQPTPEEKKAAEIIRIDHNYHLEVASKEPENISRLNVRQLVDTLGYLSLKNLQKKQFWVVKVETEKAEASITQSEQVITKMPDPKQIIEIIPQSQIETIQSQPEVLQIMDDGEIPENFIYEIAEEQEISMEDVKEIPITDTEWTVNIIPEETKPKYAYIKHCNSGKKKQHFTSEMNEITLHGGFENYYILPDVDPSVGVEITTSYEPDNYVIEEYPHLVLEEHPKKSDGRKRRKKSSVREQVKQIKTEITEDWVVDNNVYEVTMEDYEEKKPVRVRRKNKKYLL